MLSQIAAITGLNLKSIPQRWAPSLVIVVGLAGVVAVFTALLAMAAGFESTLKANGRNDAAIVMRGGSDSELNSGLSRDAAILIKQAPGIKKGADGLPEASAEAMVIAELVRKGDTRNGANITVRGVEQAAFALRPQLKIVAGRKFTPGLRELIVGRGVIQQFQGAGVGQTLRMRGSDWTVVGEFEAGDSHDSELWTDVDVAQTTFGRQGYSSVLIALDSPDALKTVKDHLQADPRLSVDVISEQDYFSAQTKQFRQQIGVLAGVVTLIMALGAIFAALNTMYAAVAARGKEIATLRAIGFGGVAIVASVMVEALVLALIGGIIGAAIAYFMFNNFSVSTLGQNFTQVVFAFKVTPKLVFLGLLIAMSVGLFGGIFPAASPSGTFLQRVKIVGVALMIFLSLEAGILGLLFGGVLQGAVYLLITAVLSAIFGVIGYALTTLVLKLRRKGKLASFPVKLLASAVLMPVIVVLGLGSFGWPCLAAMWKSLTDLDADPMLTNLRTA